MCDNWVEKCITCKHVYATDNDYIKCKRIECKYEPYNLPKSKHIKDSTELSGGHLW